MFANITFSATKSSNHNMMKWIYEYDSFIRSQMLAQKAYYRFRGANSAIYKRRGSGNRDGENGHTYCSDGFHKYQWCGLRNSWTYKSISTTKLTGRSMKRLRAPAHEPDPEQVCKTDR
jgi:hypothetical protein